MKRTYQAIALSLALALPLAGHAESSLTRGQVRNDLVAAQVAGKIPQSNTDYPEPATSAAATYVRHARNVDAFDDVGASAVGSFQAGFRATRARSLSSQTSTFDDIYRGGQ